MNRIIWLAISLVIITGLCLGQGTVRPTVINMTGAAQDSLTAMVHAKDSSITTGIPRMYVTPSLYYKPTSLVTHSGATAYTLTGTLTKGINFASATPDFTDADNAWIAMGTWNDKKTIALQTEHFVPFQINLESGSTIDIEDDPANVKDIAAARLRVDTKSGQTNAGIAINNLEMRSKLQSDFDSHANLQVSTNLTGTIAARTGVLAGYFEIQGSGALTAASCDVLLATAAYTGSGIDNVGHFTANCSGAAVTSVLNAEAINGTATNLLNIVNTGGTVTNGMSLSGAMTAGINMAGGKSYLPMIVGTKSNSDSAGVVLVGSTDNTGGVQIFGDDGSLAVGSITSPLWTRYMLTTDQTSGATQTGAYLQLKTKDAATTFTNGSITATKIFNQAGAVTLAGTAEFGIINAGMTLAGATSVVSGTMISGIDVNIAGPGAITTAGTGISAGIIVRRQGSTAFWDTGLKIADASATTGIDIGTCTTDLVLQNEETITNATNGTVAISGIVAAPRVNIGFGGSGELHPLSVGGTLAAGLDRFTVDTLGNVVGVLFNGMTPSNGLAVDTVEFSNRHVLKLDSSDVSGTASKYTTPTMMGLRVLRSDSSITTGVVGYVSSTMGATLLTKGDSSITAGTATKYVTPTMAAATFLPLASVFAAIDSFTTTGATKEITVTGATVGGAVIVTPMSPEYSTAADTGNQYSGYVKAGGGTIVVTRTKMHADSDVKSGAHFNYIYIKPR